MTVERVRRLLWAAFALVAALLFAKFFVADVYRVESGSMRPTIFAGPLRRGEEARVEWVLVQYRRGGRPERFDLVVWDRPGFGAVVKRVVALPGESLRIQDGDLLIKGERLPADAPRPPAVTVFDSDLAPVEDYFHLRTRADGGPWHAEGEEWVLDAREVRAGSWLGTMSYHPELRDDYLDADGRRVVGERTVNDAILDVELRVDEGAGRLRFTLVEKADTFELRLARASADAHAWSVELERRSAASLDPEVPDEVGTLATGTIELDPERWHRLRFANVDDHLSVEIDGEHPFPPVTYGRNSEYDERAPGADHHVGPRVELGGEGVLARFRRLRVLRDLYYTSNPEDGHAVGETQHLGADEVFLLGDNSAQSQDSRDLGPVPLGALIGEPRAVVWPPGTARWLVPREEPSGER